MYLWAFFENSPKKHDIYAKNALKVDDLDTLPTNKYKKSGKKSEKSC